MTVFVGTCYNEHMKLIIGLGNPGKQYERTRHNAGFMALDLLAGTTEFMLQKKFQAEIATLEIDGQKVIAAKPQTFMNESGLSTRALVDFYKLSPAKVVVVHDDKDIPLGKFRVQKDRGAAGHNGVASIIEHLGTKDFWRIRIGVATMEYPIEDTAEFVLGKFAKEELAQLHEATERALLELKKIL